MYFNEPDPTGISTNLTPQVFFNEPDPTGISTNLTPQVMT
jgi:hypothetical protein